MRKNRNQRNTAENTKASANTKRALIQSVVALFSCCLLLIGATYAWFTDTISTVNTIQSGNLDLNVTKKDATSEVYHIVTDETQLFDADFNWAPGAVQTVQLKVENAGDLSLAYEIGARMINNQKGINVAGDELNLADYIKFAIIEGNGAGENVELDVNALGSSGVIEMAKSCDNVNSLSAFADTSGGKAAGTTAITLNPTDVHYVTLVAYMPEEVGNEANHNGSDRPHVKFGVDFKATQLNNDNVENLDSDVTVDEVSEDDPFASFEG